MCAWGRGRGAVPVVSECTVHRHAVRYIGCKLQTSIEDVREAMRDRAKNKFNIGGIAKRKSNIQKIQEAFGTAKKKDKNKKNKQIRMMAKKGGAAKKKKKFPDLTGDGKVTFADILKGRGVINGKKKKK